jgi:hypothetical protein
MRLKAIFVVMISIALGLMASAAESKTPTLLATVATVQVDAAVVSNPEKVKEEHAANLVTDGLRNALRAANLEVGESPMHAHIELDEFTSGSTATRFLVGFGAGRSTVDCKLVITDAEGKQLYSKKIRVRGNLALSPYQGNNTQRRQAVSSFEQRLMEEIELLKGPGGGATVVAKKQKGTLALTSDPAGAEIYIDGNFLGNTPSKVTLDAGQHTVKVTAKDHKEWSRELMVSTGSEMTVNAQLEKAVTTSVGE